jgi:hypothetical protein
MAQDSLNSGQSIEIMELHQLVSSEIPGITFHAAGCMMEAARICLEEQGHRTGVRFLVNGDFNTAFSLIWDATTDQMRRCWADPEEATEQGACGLAVLLIEQLTGWTVLERSRRGTGFDYWLGRRGSEDPLFQNKVRLEISGIRQGSTAAVNRRVREKIEQTRRSDSTGLSAYVVVVEFGLPCSFMMKR